MPKKYDQEIKARAVRMVRDHLPTYGSVTRAADAVGPQLGISGNTLRRWVVQADVDDGVREGVPSEVQAELARLTAENKRLRETNEILRRASVNSTGQRNTPDDHGGGVVWRRLGGRGCRRRSGSRSGRCGVRGAR